MISNFRQQTKLEAFREHWEQMRHAENLRHTFTSFYAVMVAAVLAFISERGQGEYRILFLVLAVVSFLGLVLSWRVKHAVELHRERAERLAGELTGEKNLENYLPYSPAKVNWWQFWTLRMFFLYLYSIGTLFFLLLALGCLSIVNGPQ